MELFKIGFITIKLIDIVDIGIVTLLFYKLYEMLRGSLAIRIITAILLVFLLWKLVDFLDMVLLKSILDQFLGVGAIALIIIFSTEIRRFLLMFGKNTFLDKLVQQFAYTSTTNMPVQELINGVEDIQKAKLGALMVVQGHDNLEDIKTTGDMINSQISARLLHSIFQRNSPLHDGAAIIESGRIAAARCVLPITHNPDISPELGLRHRAALGISEVSDAFIIVISEERNEISIAKEGVLTRNVDLFTLENELRKHLKG